MADAAIWTVKSLLDWTTDFFAKGNTESPRLAAEVLLADCLSIPRIELYVRFDQEVQPDVRAVFKDRVKRHANGEPVAYLVGYREFYSMSFLVNSNVLIPRPETEDLVAETLDIFSSKKDQPLRMLDVGTGSGIIAICLAKFLKESQILAVDLKPEALKVAAANAEKLEVKDRITFQSSDLLSGLSGEEPFDAIVSNPPYVSQNELKEVSDSVKKFEPISALDGFGEDGGDLSRKLLDQSPRFLKPSGWLLMESSPMLVGSLKDYAKSQECWQTVKIIKDHTGKDRILAAQLV